MSEEIVPQVQFATLEDFIKGSNNFYAFFCDSAWGESHRRCEVFGRFQSRYPRFTRRLIERTSGVLWNRWKYKISEGEREPYPWRELFAAYRRMSQMVLADDRNVRNEDGSLDATFLLG